MVVVYDRVFVFDSIRLAFRRRGRFYAALAATWLVLAACLWSAPRSESAGFTSGVSPVTYLLNQAVIVPHYLRLAIWPSGLVVDYGWPAALTFAQVWPGALLLALLLAASVVALVKWPRVGFIAVWSIVTLAPTSSVVPIATEVGAERRMYLPLAGIVVLAAIAVAAAWNRPATVRARGPRAPQPSPAAVLAAGVLVAALGMVTMARNREYLSPLGLARTVVDRWPTPVAHATYGEELAAAGRRDEALGELRLAVAGGDFRARYALGAELFERGVVDQAAVYLREFVDEGSAPRALELDARRLLGSAYARQRNWTAAAEQYRRVLASLPDDALTRKYLADVLFAQASYGQAAAEYARYTSARPDDVDALTNLGIASDESGRHADAIAAFTRAARADPRDPGPHVNLALALARHGSLSEAETQAREAAALAPQDARVHEVLARILAAAKRDQRSR
jgi:tetratricopeptide (TPR) repeat protein